MAVDRVALFQALSVGLGLASVVILGRGGLALSPDMMAELAAAKFDYNPEVLRSLAEQATDMRVGTVLALLSPLLQVWSLGLTPSRSGIGGKRNAILLGAVASFAVLGIGHVYSSAASTAMVEQALAVHAAGAQR